MADEKHTVEISDNQDEAGRLFAEAHEEVETKQQAIGLSDEEVLLDKDSLLSEVVNEGLLDSALEERGLTPSKILTNIQYQVRIMQLEMLANHIIGHNLSADELRVVLSRVPMEARPPVTAADYMENTNAKPSED